MCLFSGSVAQLLDSLEEVEILSQAKKNDIDFLHRFFDNNKFQSLLEVSPYIPTILISVHVSFTIAFFLGTRVELKCINKSCLCNFKDL